jgi:hypothetical protein
MRSPRGPGGRQTKGESVMTGNDGIAGTVDDDVGSRIHG